MRPQPHSFLDHKQEIPKNIDPLLPETIARLGERRKAMIAAFGLFKGKDVFPDGLEYQLEMRAERN